MMSPVNVNTFLLAISGLISAITPTTLAIINNRQQREAEAKVAQAERMHSELLPKVAPPTIFRRDG